MKASLNIIKSLTDIRGTVDELVERINQQLGGVEEIISLGDKYTSAVIVRVVSADKHPNADKLTVCMIDDAGTTDHVERDPNGLVRVVCGAPNVTPGMMAVWLPPHSTVPATYDDPEPFVLDARELRGVMSFGMLAAADELGIGSDHTGIISLTPDDLPPSLRDQAFEPGQSFAHVFGLDDTIIDIENKMFTHRPDCFGQIGVAREIAGIQHMPFASPSWYSESPQFDSATGLPLRVVNEATDNVPRFMAVAVQDVTVRPSPMWLQCALVAMGSKSINNIVDVTNYLMLMTGQPLHAYDYDQLRGQQLGVRMGRPEDRLTLINSKTYEISHEDIVIIDGEGVVGLAGVMGGVDSEVTTETRNIVIESACFDMYTIRKSSMRHGLFTDAVTRFTKGQSPLQQPAILGAALDMVTTLGGGAQASVVYDKHSLDTDHTKEVIVSAQFINERLGLNLDAADVESLLGNVEIATTIQDGEVTVRPPFWRTDLELPEDIVEEVGRLYGFESLPRKLPRRSIAPAPANLKFVTSQRIRDSLRQQGANEVLTYSFVHADIMRRAEQDVSQAFQLSNALSPDLQYYRLTPLPSLLDRVNMNIRAGHDEFTLYEIGKGHNKKYHREDDDGLPGEIECVDMVYTSRQSRDGAAYYRVRRMVSRLARDFGVEVVYQPMDETMDYPLTAPFDLARSATVHTIDGAMLGMVGELKSTVRSGFKLPDYTAAASLDLEAFVELAARDRQVYKPLSRYPSTSRDVSLRVPGTTTYRAMYDTVMQAVKQYDTLDIQTALTTIYQPEGADRKTFTFHLDITSHERTLKDADITPLIDDIAARASRALQAEMV